MPKMHVSLIFVGVVTVSVVVSFCNAVPAPVPELVIATPLYYPHGRSNNNNQNQIQNNPQLPQHQITSQSSMVPQVVKPPPNIHQGESRRPGHTRGPPFGDWGNDQSLYKSRDMVRDRDRENRDFRDMDRENRGGGSGNGRGGGGSYPTLSSLLGYGSSKRAQQQHGPKLIIAKPLFHPGEKQGKVIMSGGGNGNGGAPQAHAVAQESQTAAVNSAAANQVKVEAAEQGAIEIPEMGGIEYYDLMNHIRTWADTVKDVAVRTPGKVASVVQTAWRGSSNLLAQVKEHMPDVDMPPLALPFKLQLPNLLSSGEDTNTNTDTYVEASQLTPLAPFPYFSNSFMSSKKRPPIESYWLDNYGV